MKRYVVLVILALLISGCRAFEIGRKMIGTAIDPLHTLTTKERTHVEGVIESIKTNPAHQRQVGLTQPLKHGDTTHFFVVDRLENGYSANFVKLKWEFGEFKIRGHRRVFSDDPNVVIDAIQSTTKRPGKIIPRQKIWETFRKELGPPIPRNRKGGKNEKAHNCDTATSCGRMWNRSVS